MVGLPGRVGEAEYDVRLARPGEEHAVCAVCRQGFALSSEGLLSSATIARQAQTYYNPERVRREIAAAHETPRWQGYVVAVSHRGDVLGAAGGGVTDRDRGNVYVLYLEPSLRGNGIGSALLDFVSAQQRSAGAIEQWVTVTEGNELGLPFYRARGFTVRDRVAYAGTSDDPDGPHSLRMSRPMRSG